MARAKQKNLPNPMSNPLIVMAMVNELKEHYKNVDKAAHDEGRVEQEKGRLLQIKAFAWQMQQVAEANIGDQLDGVEGF